MLCSRNRKVVKGIIHKNKSMNTASITSIKTPRKDFRVLQADPSILPRWCAISSVISDLINSFHHFVASLQKKSRGEPCPTPLFC